VRRVLGRTPIRHGEDERRSTDRCTSQGNMPHVTEHVERNTPKGTRVLGKELGPDQSYALLRIVNWVPDRLADGR
jgi:hypothetical protein